MKLIDADRKHEELHADGVRGNKLSPLAEVASFLDFSAVRLMVKQPAVNQWCNEKHTMSGGVSPRLEMLV